MAAPSLWLVRISFGSGGVGSVDVILWLLSVGAAGCGCGDGAESDAVPPGFEEGLGAEEGTVGVADLEVEVGAFGVAGVPRGHDQLPGGHVGSGLDEGLGAVAVRVGVSVGAGDVHAPSASAPLRVGTRRRDVGDGAGVGGVDGGAFGDREVGGGVVVVGAADLGEGDRIDREGEGVDAVGGDRALGEAEGPVVGDPAGDSFDVFGRVVVAEERRGEVVRRWCSRRGR